MKAPRAARLLRQGRPGTARPVAVGIALAATVLAAGCAAGQQAETAQEKPTLDGTNADIGSIALRGLAVVTPDANSYPVGSNPQLRLVIVNNGDSDDRLTSISTSVTDGWGSFASRTAYDAATAPRTVVPSNSISVGAPDTSSSTGTTPTGTTSSDSASSDSASPAASSSSSAPTDTPVTVPDGVATSFGVPAADGRILALLDTRSVLYPGSTVAITFTFAEAGSKTVQVPIEITDAGTFTPSPSYFPDGTKGNEEGS